MSRFEDRLLVHLIDNHGARLAQADPAPQPRQPHGRRGGRLAAAAAAAAAALALAAGVVAATLSSGGSTPAYAVEVHSDGTVVLTLDEIVGVEGANAQLSKLDVKATIARVEAGCTQTGVIDHSRGGAAAIHNIVQPSHTGETGVRWTINPAAIPPGDTLSLSAQRLEGSTSNLAAYRIALYQGAAPSCTRPGTFYTG